MSGKSYIGLMYPLKYAHDPHFRGVIFRRTNNELIAQGGLWENACEMYQKVFGKDKIKINQKNLKITFPSGASVKFSYMGSDQDRLAWQGSQITFCLFDFS